MQSCKVAVIGAGVVGLAIAAELSSSVDDIVVIERNDSYGRETSSRNSEVIHSGIYYPPGSLKARLCVEGRLLLYGLAARHDIPCRRTGKLIVAAEAAELSALENLAATGRANGVERIELLDVSAMRLKEPAVLGTAALFLPETGIIDSHRLMKHFYDTARSRGVQFAFGTAVNAVERTTGGFLIGVAGEEERLAATVVINAAGLGAEAVAAMAGMDTAACGLRLRLCKGSYFSYAKPSPLSMLVYPVPHANLAGLGVHATIDLGGRLRFGPDVEYVDAISYEVNEAKKSAFAASAARLVAGLDASAFQPDMAGVRPKLQGPGEPFRDFVIGDESVRGLPGLVNLVGIESPGLTASPAIAKYVAATVRDILV